jgi:carbon-monoxide dehydrogenase large subunit
MRVNRDKMAGDIGATGQGVGQSVPRKEDDRYLRGKGEFVGDIRLAGMLELAFLRSPLAHARLRNIAKPKGYEDRVFVASDLVGVLPITALTTLPGFKPSSQPVLVTDKVRHVGEALAVCVAATRAEAEDIAAAIELDLEELPAVHDMVAACQPGSPLVHGKSSWSTARPSSRISCARA